MTEFLIQACIYLGAAVIAVPLAARLGLGSVLGYLMAGIVIGPVLGLVGAETTDLQHFAEFGVVMMLFLIGLELEPRALWDMRDRLIGLGGLQVSLTTGLIMGGAMILGLEWKTALAVGLIFALSSTAIVLQTLNEKGLMQTGGGRSTFSVLLTQDIAVIPMLALLPLLAVVSPVTISADGSLKTAAHAEDAHHTISLVEGLPAWGVTLVTLGAVGVVILAGVFLTRPLFRYIHMAKLREIHTATGLLLVVAIAVLMSMVGLSAALGTFLAGVVLANSEFRHELESDLAPFKGLLLGLFFITVGAGINFTLLFGAPVLILALTVGVIAIKGGVLFILGLLFKLKGRDQWLFTLGLAQAGEFGFVLISFSLQQNVLPQSLSETLLLVIALSMLVTPLLFILYEMMTKNMADTNAHIEPDEIDEENQIIIAGVGRFGQVVNRMVQNSGFRATVLDHNLDTINLLRKFGLKGFFGDPTRPDLLHSAGLDTAKVLIVSVDDKNAATQIVKYARKHRPDLHIVARAYDRVHVYQLFAAGADDIVREMFDASLRAGRYALEAMGLSEFEAHEAEVNFYKLDRAAVKDLAQLYDPNIPILENGPYIERAKEMNRDLETALAGQTQNPDGEPENQKA
ncbi:cation:proton antiporter [Algirhabdus cladophorae]|uniref:cation:proton antiporter domain-containing protein n=1 Tax=Algirhabdus cladophorae TaxID=3377108 RepID=UPI003B845162